MDVTQVRSDLLAEQHDLDEIVAALGPDEWSTPTSSPRWNVADQIAHLTFFDYSAARAISDPSAFGRDVEQLAAAAAEGDAAVEQVTLGEFRSLRPDELLERWREGRRLLAEASLTLDNDTRIGWYGPSMGSKSFLTARLMETWAHGQDIVDALEMTRPPTDRLRHVAQLGFITRAWSYINRGMVAPDEPVRVELTAPSGAVWAFGPEDASESVTGPAEDFCLVVVQRRHLDDTSLVVSPLARDWLLHAQAFAGRATDGPPAGSRT